MAAKRTAARSEPCTWKTVVAIDLELPDMEESTSYGTPALKANGKLIARAHQDGVSLVVRIDFDSRDVLRQADPETFYITDHYRDYQAMLVRLSSVRKADLRRLIEQAYKDFGTKKKVKR
jgi:hypothetical protein